MTLDEIKDIMAGFAASDLTELALTRGEWTLRLTRAVDGSVRTGNAATPPATSRARRPAAPQAARVPEVHAPLAGLVYLNPQPDAPPFVEAGATVEAGAIVAVIEAMKVFNEVRAEQGGTLAEVLVASGDEVDAGQTLMRFA